MRLQRAAVVSLLLFVCPAVVPARAQDWQDAYQRRDYAAAAAALGPIVFEHARADGERYYPDARATQALGRMYAAGLGVRQDPVIACALFGLATGSAVYQHGDRHAVTAAARQLLDEECVKLTVEERREAAKLVACPSLGAEPQTFTLGGAHRVEVARGIVRIQHRDARRNHWLGDLVDCAPAVPMIRHTAVKPPKGSGLPVRHFLEVLAWRAKASHDGGTVRLLEWRAVEVRGTELAVAARTALGTGTAAAATVPAERTVTMKMLGNGQVRWQTAGEPRASGIIKRSDSRARAQTRRQQQ